LAYRRIYEEEEVNIFLNYSNKRIQLKASNPNSKIIFSTLSNRLADGSKIKENLILSPLEGILLKKF
ncbi:MAG: hypothetical protein ACW98X_18645, partial [Promethearchaeota archaeon]